MARTGELRSSYRTFLVGMGLCEATFQLNHFSRQLCLLLTVGAFGF